MSLLLRVTDTVSVDCHSMVARRAMTVRPHRMRWTSPATGLEARGGAAPRLQSGTGCVSVRRASAAVHTACSSSAAPGCATRNGSPRAGKPSTGPACGQHDAPGLVHEQHRGAVVDRVERRHAAADPPPGRDLGDRQRARPCTRSVQDRAARASRNAPNPGHGRCPSSSVPTTAPASARGVSSSRSWRSRRVAPRPRRASSTSPRQGSATTPTSGRPPRVRQSDMLVQGTPFARFVVPSTGSRYQRCRSPGASPYSSPRTRASGTRTATRPRTCCSTSRSTSVTRSAGFAFVVTAPTGCSRVKAMTSCGDAVRQGLGARGDLGLGRFAVALGPAVALGGGECGADRGDVVRGDRVDAEPGRPDARVRVVDGPARRRCRPRACAASTVRGVRNATSRLSVDGVERREVRGGRAARATPTPARRRRPGSTERTARHRRRAPRTRPPRWSRWSPATVRAATTASSASVRSTSRVDRQPSSRSSAPSSRGIRSRPLPSRATSHQVDVGHPAGVAPHPAEGLVVEQDGDAVGGATDVDLDRLGAERLGDRDGGQRVLAPDARRTAVGDEAWRTHAGPGVRAGRDHTVDRSRSGDRRRRAPALIGRPRAARRRGRRAPRRAAPRSRCRPPAAAR